MAVADGQRQRSVRGTHWPALDGVRALAVLLVIGVHTSGLFPGGFVGVDLFFVLSGFLITSLLLGESARTGSVAFAAFYERRALRLLPALGAAIVLAVALAVTVAPHQYEHPTISGVPWVILYGADYARVLDQSSLNLGLLQHTWSLAVEEQFYALWPLLTVVWLARSNRRLRTAATLGVLAVVDMVWQTYLVHTAGISRAYYSLDGHAMGLLAGSGLAVALSAGRQLPVRWLPALRRWAWVALAGIVVVGLEGRGTSARLVVSIAATTGAGVVLLASLAMDQAGRLTRLLSSRVAVWTGKRSYGLYLYHYIVIFALAPYGRVASAPDRLAFVAGSFVLAAVSYRMIEAPFLRWKDRLGPSPAALRAEPA